MRLRRVFFGALVALAGEGCSSSTGPQYNITGLWTLETPAAVYSTYQLAQSGSKVAGFHWRRRASDRRVRLRAGDDRAPVLSAR